LTAFVSLKLIYSQLPNNLADYKIFLMDAMLATGATTIMALRVLMDHQALEVLIITGIKQ